MYPDNVYPGGGGMLVGAVGVAGLPQFIDQKAARAAIAAWETFRASKR